MPPDPNSMQSSPDSLLASLQPSSHEYLKQASLQPVGSEEEGGEGEISSSLFTSRRRGKISGLFTAKVILAAVLL